jgi:glycosyltransferase involved in cell wall biosynthesis
MYGSSCVVGDDAFGVRRLSIVGDCTFGFLVGKVIRSMALAAAEVKLLNVAIVVSGLGAGGAERVVSILSREWVEIGHRVTVICFESEKASSYYPLDSRITTCRLELPPIRSGPFVAVGAVVRRVRVLRQVLGEISPDVIISFLSRTNILTLLSSRGMDIPIIISERNNPNMQRLGFTWNLLRRATYRRAFGMVTMTKGALQYFPESMRARSWVIPNPVIIPQDLPKRQNDGSRDGKILTAVGRLVHQKGFDLLIKAFAAIAPAFPDWKLVIWGEGPERASLEQLRIAMGLKDCVLLPGVSKHPSGWIAGADAFVLSSRYEGWGNALLEAMASGLPVVSFDCPWGPSEMIQDGIDGILVPRENVRALSEALRKIIGDQGLRERFGAKAAAAARRYSHESIVASWNLIISQAIENKIPQR